MDNILSFDQSPRRSFAEQKSIRSYLALIKQTLGNALRKFDIAKNLIAEGMLVWNRNAIGQEWNSGDLLTFEKCHKLLSMVVAGLKKSFVLIWLFFQF